MRLIEPFALVQPFILGTIFMTTVLPSPLGGRRVTVVLLGSFTLDSSLYI